MMPRILVPIIAVIIVVAIAFFGFTTGGYVIHALLLAAPIVLMMASNIGMVFALVMGLRFSDLILPGLPQGLNMMDVVILFLIALILGGHSITKQRMIRWSLSHYALLGFALVLAIIIALRGIGIRFLGSNEWGGFAYIKIAIFIAFYLICGRLRITEKQVKLGLILMLLLSTVPAVAQAVFYLTGGAVYIQYMFLEAYTSGLLSTLDAVQSDAGTARFYFTGLASALVVGAMAFFPLERRSRIFFVLFWMAGFFITLLSGFRGATVGIAGTTLIFLVLYYPRRRIVILTASTLAFTAILVGLTPFIPDLPAGVQRALSWVPWYDIPFFVKMDAAISTEWRLDVWNETMRKLPNYLLLGRGLTFNSAEVQAALALRDTISWAYISHNYHSGPLSVLVTTGIPGAFLFVLFSIMIGLEGIKGMAMMRRQGTSVFMMRVYVVFLAHLLYSIASFYLIYGDMKSSFPNLLFLAALLQVLRLNFVSVPGVAVESAESASALPDAAGITKKSLSLPYPAGQVVRGSAP